MDAAPVGNSNRDELVMARFTAAMSLPPEERDGFLCEACGQDAEMLADVRRRIAWEVKMKGFLSEPLVSPERMDRPFAPGDIAGGEFEILRECGEGGMGVVYEARHLKLNQRVALKCPRFEFRRRLSPEALHALSVTHPNVCRVHNLHTAPTTTGMVDFLSMEFLDGETLTAFLPTAPKRWLETSDGKTVARQICEGLEAIHKQGIVHRDLKTANIMLSSDRDGSRRAVIMDFGIAETSDVFHSQARGTPFCLAPEIWMGGQATVRSDIYSLGVILYEMASLRHPWPDGGDWSVRLKGLPAPPEASAAYRSIILRCLHPDPAKRYASAAAVASAMRNIFTRRALVAGAAAAVAAYAGKEILYPGSAVRLAVLPASFDAGVPDQEILQAFASDIAYSLKTLKQTRRPLVVFERKETAAEDVKTIDAAARFGATHVLASSVRRSGAGWTVEVDLARCWDSRVLGHWTREILPETLASVLFGLQSEVVGAAVRELALRPRPRQESLPPEAYANYLRGIYFARVEYQRVAEAVPFFEAVIRAAPQSALGYAGLAEALLGVRIRTRDQSLDGKAIAALDRAEKLDPDLAHVRLIAARLSAEGQFYERAYADARRAAEIDPTDPEAYIVMAYMLFLLKRTEESEAALQKALAVQPGYYRPFLVAGLFYYEIRNYTEAEKYWKEAVRLAPGQVAPRINLAIVYLNSGRAAESERLLQESLRIRRTPSALEMQGDLQLASGRNREAVDSYVEAFALGRASYAIFASTAVAYSRLGDSAKVAETLRRGLRFSEAGLPSSPRDAEMLAWCAYFHAALGEMEPARARARQAEELASTRGNVRKRLILAYGWLEDIGAAQRLLSGATPDLKKEIANSPELAPALRRNPQLQQQPK